MTDERLEAIIECLEWAVDMMKAARNEIVAAVSKAAAAWNRRASE